MELEVGDLFNAMLLYLKKKGLFATRDETVTGFKVNHGKICGS